MKQYFILFIIVILSNFFGFVEIPRLIRLMILICCLLYGYKSYVSYPINKFFIVYFVGLIISAISCQIYQSQKILNSIIALIDYWEFALFFLFSSKIFSINDLRSALSKLAFIVTILYFLQYILLQNGISLRGVQYEQWDDIGLIRNRINCSSIIYLLFFYKLRSYLETRKTYDIFILFVTFADALIMNFRSILFGLFIFGVFLIYKQKNEIKLFSVCVLLAIGLIGASQSSFVKLKTEQMMSRQESQTLDNDDYIRNLTFTYFMTDHFKDPFERFAGSGLPDGKSNYSEKMRALVLVGYQYSDWGLIGLSWILGVTTVIGILLVFYRFYHSTIEEMVCERIWIMFLPFVSILTFELPRMGNFLVYSLVFAYIIKCHQNQLNKIDFKS